MTNGESDNDKVPSATSLLTRRGLRMGQIYGHNTIHNSNEVNVEVDKHGTVVGVWFRCMMLPFDVTEVSAERAKEMKTANKELKERDVKIQAIEFNHF